MVDIETIEGEPLEVTEQIIRRELSGIIQTQESLYSSWKEDLQDSTALEVSANTQLQEARNLIDAQSPPETQNTLEQAEQAYEEGDYMEARKLAIQASSQARMETGEQTTNVTHS